MESLDHHTDTTQRWAGLKVRVASAAVLATIFLSALWLGGWFFIMVSIAAGLQMQREWDGLTSGDNIYWKAAGIAYVAVPCASLIWLRFVHTEASPNAGMGLVLYILLVVWATDIGAYFTGRQIGGPKLSPRLSPNKTWAGLGGGIVSAAVVGGFCASFTPYPPSFIAAMDLGVVLAVVAQAGDLFESWLKRRVGAKDSSALIPGHGGLLDRVDGLTFTLPFFVWLVFISGLLS